MRQYLDSISHVMENGRQHSDRTGVTTRRVFGYQNRYDLSLGYPLLTTKKLSFRWIAEELIWFLSGDTNNKTLQDKKITIWDEWATKEQCYQFGREENDLGPIYGHCWRNFGATARQVYLQTMGNSPYPEDRYDKDGRRWCNRGFENDGVDQIRNLCDTLTKNPDSRRMIVSGWDAKQCDKVSLPPCHTLFHFVAEDTGEGPRKLHCQLYQRSCDSALGLPYNIASYSLLTMILAHVHNMIPGDFVHSFGDLHIYANHFDGLNEQLSRVPRTLPTLKIDESLRGGGFDALMSMKYEHLTLNDYTPYPKIDFEVAI